MAICRGRTRPAPLPTSITPPEEIEAEADRNAAIILAWQATGLDFMTALRLMLAGKIPEGMDDCTCTAEDCPCNGSPDLDHACEYQCPVVLAVEADMDSVNDVPEDLMAADERLTEAAPAMLDALEELLAEAEFRILHTGSSYGFHLAEDAVRKAKGLEPISRFPTVGERGVW